MTNLTGRMPTRGKEYSEHDDNEQRKRVAIYADGDTVSYEDSNFTSADDQTVCDVLTDLGRAAHHGYLINSGPGKIKVELSANGTTYGGQHTIKEGEVLTFENLTIRKIRLTWVTNTDYRILAA